MELRKILLRVMLWSLAVAAVIGAASVFMQGDFRWRVIGSIITTAVAAALLMPASILVDKPNARGAGLLAMAVVLVEYFATLALIWEALDRFGSSNSDRIGLSMLWLFFCGTPAVILLILHSRPEARFAARTGLALATASLALLLLGTWATDHLWSSAAEKEFLSAGAIGGLGFLLVCCLGGIRFDASPSTAPLPLRIVRIIGTLAATLSLAVALYAIWAQINSGGGAFACIISIAVVAAHVNLCMIVPLAGAQRWIRIITISALVVSALFCDIVAVVGEHAEPLLLFASAAGIVAGCGSLALIILYRFNRKVFTPVEFKEVRELSLYCPGCGKKHTLPVGESSCPTCLLKFVIQVQEPRCPTCNYLLFMLQSDRCPECGTLIRASTPPLPPQPAPTPA